MHLREFLYVDTEKVRAMLAQLDGGIAEGTQEAQRHDKKTEGGVKGFGLHQQSWGTEEYVNKSLGDALFPTLEEALTSQGHLVDISEEVHKEELWTSGGLSEAYPPGTIVRITSPGALFDARYVATALASFVTSYTGVEEVSASVSSGSGTQKRPGKPGKKKVADEQADLEDIIPDFQPMDVEEGWKVTPQFLRGLVKVARGLFMPGLHLNLIPTENDRLSISARLQEGRSYLDTEVEILFARYGLGLQEWTLVGSIGHYAEESNDVSINSDLASGEIVLRARTAKFINSFMGLLGRIGFSDAPQFPGFSVVPLAVYRSIPSRDIETPI